VAQVPMSPLILDSCPAPEWTPEDDRADIAAIRNNVFDGERIDGVYRDCESGVRVLAVTNRRLMMVETTSWRDRVALTSVPFGRITSVGFLASPDSSVASSTTVGIRVLAMLYELGCQTSTRLARCTT
jgi:hypothetical protein